MTDVNVPATTADALKQIRVTMKVLGFLQASEQLDAENLREAEAAIDAALLVIERGLATGQKAIPLLTLGEVAARFPHHAKPALTVVPGGAA